MRALHDATLSELRHLWGYYVRIINTSRSQDRKDRAWKALNRIADECVRRSGLPDPLEQL